MFTALDHVIIGVNDLALAEAVFSQQLGLAVVGGGVHPSGGTANRIVLIGDTYLELITMRTPAEARSSMRERLAKGDGYLNFVLASDDLEADSAALVERGITIVGPTVGQLCSSDGRSRGWVRTDIERADLTQHYPFLIQHDSAGEERRFRLAGWMLPPRHALGAIKVLSTTIAVENLTEATQRFQDIYGLVPSQPFMGAAEGWDATLVSFALDASGQQFELAEPDQGAVNRAPTPGEEGLVPLWQPGGLARHLELFGESLCRMALVVQNMVAARSYLDKHKVSYTYRDMPSPVLWIHPRSTSGATIMLHEDGAR